MGQPSGPIRKVAAQNRSRQIPSHALSGAGAAARCPAGGITCQEIASPSAATASPAPAIEPSRPAIPSWAAANLIFMRRQSLFIRRQSLLRPGNRPFTRGNRLSASGNRRSTRRHRLFIHSQSPSTHGNFGAAARKSALHELLSPLVRRKSRLSKLPPSPSCRKTPHSQRPAYLPARLPAPASPAAEGHASGR